MKKSTVTIPYDDEKLAAIHMYLGKKEKTLDEELQNAMDTLYEKNVPVRVREFIELRSGGAEQDSRVVRRPRAEKDNSEAATSE